MQYYINYVLGIEQGVGLKTEQGTIVHKVLECLALLKKQHQEDKPLEIDTEYGKIQTCETKLHTKEFVDHIVERTYEYYVQRSKNAFTKKSFTDCQKWVHMELEFNNGLFDPRKRNIVCAENKFDFVIDKPWAKYKFKHDDKDYEGQLSFKGTIDLITKVDDKTYEIIDYKTGQRKNWATGEEKTYEKLCKDTQLMLYYYAASRLFPEVENIIITIFFIRDGGPFTIFFDKQHIIEAERVLKKHFERVTKNKFPRMLSTTQSDFRCTKLCSYFKNNQPGTDQNICRFIHNQIKLKGIDHTTANFKNVNHDISGYKNPGE